MKTFTKYLLGIGVLVVLTGCADVSADEEDTLTWITNTADSPDSPDEDTNHYVNENIEMIENKYGLSMQHDIHTNNIDEAMARLQEQATTGRAPDMALIDGFTFDRFVDDLQPLDELFEEYEMDINDFLPFAQDVMVGDDGHIYGIYFNTNIRNIFYDETIIPEPPETWDEAMTISEELVDQGYEGLAMPLGIDEGTAVTSLWPMFWGQGGELVNENGERTFGKGDNYQYMLNVFEAIDQGVEQGLIPQRMATLGKENDLNAEVAAGQTPMFFGGSFQTGTVEDILGPEFENWEVAPLPTLEDSESTSTIGGWVWGIFTEDEEKQHAAFEFLKNTFVGKEGMGQYTSMRGLQPVRESVYESEEFDQGPFGDEYLEILEEEGRDRPASLEYSSISLQLQTAISEVVSGRKSPEQALDDAWEIATFGEEETE
ncbi:multiple sugar transport system substrate-binding protein [Geomicrobium halophilum]|uniref:Multiple sugar transport system substrate-binding protein n=1 Tax=Geomicrobium halophilum TaxID=549000 RepID=A0A841PSZ3_9BACL|nr:extracellular solute-binding protein [Geomicrobium halophilum]MBB6450884.1 multiple sugar transport system substrate-binding protein [Geomicrobium halophilum]